jgi:clathrin heavy chain
MPEFTGQLVAEVEKRNRLKMLRPWLEGRAQEGSQEADVHNGLGKIYVEINYSAQQFLTTNKFYDSAVVGK